MNFSFDCNGSDVIYLLSCTVCGRQYTGTTVTKFRESFNQYKSNVNLYSQGVRGLTQEKMNSHIFDFEHNGSIDDIHVQILTIVIQMIKEEENPFGLKRSKQCIHLD